MKKNSSLAKIVYLHSKYQIVGWREWLSLPELGIPKIKAKIDTGARTSALHAFEIQPYKSRRKHYIRFKIHPQQRCTNIVMECKAEVKDIRWVSDSGGHRERRYVIQTLLKMGRKKEMIELTLTDRDKMHFRMLLGRTAMRQYFIVNPAHSFLLEKSGKKK